MSGPPLNVATVYETATGEIVGSLTFSGPAGAVNGAGAGQAQIAGAYDGATYYINVAGGTPPPPPVLRPAMGVACSTTTIVANGTAAADLTGVPTGATVSIDGGAPETITDGELNFTATVAGTYSIVFSHFPALDDTFSIVATAA